MRLSGGHGSQCHGTITEVEASTTPSFCTYFTSTAEVLCIAPLQPMFSLLLTVTVSLHPFGGAFIFLPFNYLTTQIQSRGWGELTVVKVGTVETLCFHGFHVVNGQEGQGVVLPAP